MLSTRGDRIQYCWCTRGGLTIYTSSLLNYNNNNSYLIERNIRTSHRRLLLYIIYYIIRIIEARNTYACLRVVLTHTHTHTQFVSTVQCAQISCNIISLCVCVLRNPPPGASLRPRIRRILSSLKYKNNNNI